MATLMKRSLRLLHFSRGALALSNPFATGLRPIPELHQHPAFLLPFHQRIQCYQHSFSSHASSFQLHQRNVPQEAVVAVEEARRLLRLVNVEAMKQRLESDGQECMPYTDLLQLCQAMGVASSHQEAKEFSRALDEAGVVLIFRDKVYLHPQKVAELVANVVPLALIPEDDPRHEELERLQREKEDIDKIAHRHMRRLLWSGLGYLTLQTALFFRLTFWELSWDVMEPIAFFVTTGGILAGYTYFLITSRDPTYQDCMKRLFLSKQKKLIKRRRFDIQRLEELERRCKAGWNPPQFRRTWDTLGADLH